MIEGVAPEFMLERCFLQFQSCDKVPDLEKEITILEQRRDAFEIEDEGLIEKYHETKLLIDQLQSDVRDVVNHPTYCLPYLQVGRLLKITLRNEYSSEQHFGWGCILNHQKRTTKSKEQEDVPTYIVDVLINCAKGTESGTKTPILPGESGGEMCVIVVNLNAIEVFSSARINVPKDLKNSDARESISKVIREVEKRCNGTIPLLDPVIDMGIKDASFVKLYQVNQIIVDLSILENRSLGSNIKIQRIHFTHQPHLSLQRLYPKTRTQTKNPSPPKRSQYRPFNHPTR